MSWARVNATVQEDAIGYGSQGHPIPAGSRGASIMMLHAGAPALSHCHEKKNDPRQFLSRFGIRTYLFR